MDHIIIKDVYGKAILDYQKGINAIITTHSSVGGKDELPVEYLFRSFEEMPEIEQIALGLTKGKVLDLGCGAGSHSLYLQDKKYEVKAIDISEGAIETCRLRGVKNIELMNLWDLKSQKFATILALMNGVGLCGSINKLDPFLQHLKTILAPGGQILTDSSDIIYMFEDENGNIEIENDKAYYGELNFEMVYKTKSSGRFPWLYLDFHNLKHHAEGLGFNCELIKKGSHYDYLARLTIAS